MSLEKWLEFLQNAGTAKQFFTSMSIGIAIPSTVGD
jgi:hypothetical protein